MTILLLVLAVGGLLLTLISKNDEGRAMKEFCELECRQNFTNKYHFCC